MSARRDLLPGALVMWNLKTLTAGPLHGYGISLYIKQRSKDVLRTAPTP